MPRWLKRLLRPLIPDRVMARYRLRQHSLQVRTNVDVLVARRRARRRWLAVTPDTYRVGPEPSPGPGPIPDGVVVLGDDRFADRAVAALVATGAAAAVAGVTARPRLVARRRTEPAVEPLTIAVGRDALAEGGGEPPAGDLVAAHRRLRDAGHRLALVPVAEGDPVAARRDPISGPVAVVAAGVPIHDVGGGSRSVQLAVELLRRGYRVAHVSLFGSTESADIGLRFVHADLEQYRLDEFDPDRLAARAAAPGVLVVEMPHPALAPTIEALRGHGWRLVYDIIDEWAAPSLGGEWHDAAFERSLVEAADLVTASAPDLQAWAGERALLLPNAVDADLFAPGDQPTPGDLPPGSGPVLGYHGSMYGDWIDWEAIGEVAAAYPEARVVLIGDHGKGYPALPGNVHFLGLRRQDHLPGYVAAFTVGLVPFVVSEVTHAVSPLKVYEYLASAVPVAAPPLRSLAGLHGVHVADRLVDAVATALAAGRPDPAPVLAGHSWARRVETMLRALGVDPPPRSGDPPRRMTRPVSHWGRVARRL